MVVHICCLSACAESGLKWEMTQLGTSMVESLCLRGEWIEIQNLRGIYIGFNSLSACAESGLKSKRHGENKRSRAVSLLARRVD